MGLLLIAKPPCGKEGILLYRSATRADLPTLVKMLADDPLGAKRETSSDPLPESYGVAFAAIEADPNNDIVVAERQSMILGFLQITYIPYLTYRGRYRALIEGVRVRSDLRGQGVGMSLVSHAIELAKGRECHLVQLTTDKRRPEALSFYEQLGFQASHEGLKLHLES